MNFINFFENQIHQALKLDENMRNLLYWNNTNFSEKYELSHPILYFPSFSPFFPPFFPSSSLPLPERSFLSFTFLKSIASFTSLPFLLYSRAEQNKEVSNRVEQNRMKYSNRSAYQKGLYLDCFKEEMLQIKSLS